MEILLKDFCGGEWRGERYWCWNLVEDFCGRWWRILVETFCERFCVVDFLDFFVVAICVVFMWKILVGEWTAVCDPDICV